MNDVRWFVAQDRQQLEGEHGTADVIRLLHENPQSSFMVWRTGMDTWANPETVPEIQQELESTHALASVPVEQVEEIEGFEAPEVKPPAAEPVIPPSEVVEELEEIESEPIAQTPVEQQAVQEPKRQAVKPQRPATSASVRRVPVARVSKPQAEGLVGTLKGLLDFRFERLIARDIVKVIYILLIVVVGLVLLAMVVSAGGSILTGLRFSSFGTILTGVLLLLMAPLVAALYLALFRVGLEVVVVLFRIFENTTDLLDRVERLEGRE